MNKNDVTVFRNGKIVKSSESDLECFLSTLELSSNSCLICREVNCIVKKSLLHRFINLFKV